MSTLTVTAELDVPDGFDPASVVDAADFLFDTGGDPTVRPLADHLALYLGAAVECLYTEDVDGGISVGEVAVRAEPEDRCTTAYTPGTDQVGWASR